MRVTEALREAWAMARAQRVPTVVVALLVAAMCVASALTVGRSAAAQEQVEARLDAAGSRELVVIDAAGKGFLTSSVVGAVAGLSTVDRAVGLGTPVDVTVASVGRGGALVTARTLQGEADTAVELLDGRWPVAGEALMSRAAQADLGLSSAAGAVVDQSGAVIPVVGTFEAKEPFADDLPGVMIASSATTTAQRLVVIATSSAASAPTQDAVLALVARSDPQDLLITSPQTLAEVQAEIAGDLTAYGRGLLLAVLGAGAALVALVVLAETLTRRSDLGRRRALGASRPDLVLLVVARTAMSACLGAALGIVVAVVSLRVLDDQVPADFLLGAAVLSVLAAAGAALLPAWRAARHDPVRVLRTP